MCIRLPLAADVVSVQALLGVQTSEIVVHRFCVCVPIVVRAMGFEPTTSGPKTLRVLGDASAPGSPRAFALWYPVGGNRVPRPSCPETTSSDLF